MGYYFAIMLGVFTLIPPITLVGVVILSATLLFYFYEKREENKNRAASVKRNNLAKIKKDRKAHKLLTDPEYAKEIFFYTFFPFSGEARHDGGRKLLNSIKNKIVIPVIWEEEYEEMPLDMDNQAQSGAVLKGYNSNRQLIATHRKVIFSGPEYYNNEGVPTQDWHISKTQEIVTLNDGHEVKIDIPTVAVKGSEGMGEVEYSFGNFLQQKSEKLSNN